MHDISLGSDLLGFISDEEEGWRLFFQRAHLNVQNVSAEGIYFFQRITVYEDPGDFSAVLGDHIDELTRRGPVKIAREFQMQTGTASVGHYSKIGCHDFTPFSIFFKFNT